jgi:hypothetical protein
VTRGLRADCHADEVPEPAVTERSVDPADAAERPRRRRWRWAVAAVAAVLLVYPLVLVVAPLLPRPKVARGGLRLYDCQVLGGDIPSGFRGAVGVFRDHEVARLTSVRDGETIYVAATVVDPQGNDLGAAVWTASYRNGGPFPPVQAANDVARSVAGNPGGTAADPSASAVDAAASCAVR